MIFILEQSFPHNSVPSYEALTKLFRNIEGDYSRSIRLCLNAGPREEGISLEPYYLAFLGAYNKRTGFNYTVSRRDVGMRNTYIHISFLGKNPSELDVALLYTPVTHTDRGKKREYTIPNSKVIRRLIEQHGALHSFRDKGLHRIVAGPISNVSPRTFNLVPEDTREFQALLAAALQGK